MKRQISSREKQLLRILFSVTALCAAAIGAILICTELRSLGRQIAAGRAFIESTETVSEEKLVRLRRLVAGQKAAVAQETADSEPISLIEIGERVRAIARKNRIEIYSYSQNTKESRLNFSGECDARQIYSLLAEIHSTLSSVTVSRLLLSRSLQEEQFRFELGMVENHGNGFFSPPSNLSDVRILSFLGHSLPIRQAVPEITAQRVETEQSIQENLPESLPVDFVGEAVVAGTVRIFLKEQGTGRLLILSPAAGQRSEGGYRLHENGRDEIQIEYKKRIYVVSKE